MTPSTPIFGFRSRLRPLQSLKHAYPRPRYCRRAPASPFSLTRQQHRHESGPPQTNTKPKPRNVSAHLRRPGSRLKNQNGSGVIIASHPPRSPIIADLLGNANSQDQDGQGIALGNPLTAAFGACPARGRRLLPIAASNGWESGGGTVCGLLGQVGRPADRMRHGTTSMCCC
jgi:hypothetical protein